jgi:peptidoglycan/LPS O-acetylase OafA/YrhL
LLAITAELNSHTSVRRTELCGLGMVSGASLLQMEHEFSIFLLTAGACYVLAFLTSYAFVRLLLPEKLKDALGHDGRFVAIDGIRGYLAFGVYVHHCLVTWMLLRQGQWLVPNHNFENQLGKTSVAIFFMITAFLFWGRAVSKRAVDVKAFFLSRLFRIYPLYLFVVLVICLAVGFKTGWSAHESPAKIALEVGKWLLLRTPTINLYAGTAIVVAGVTWTLLYEAWFYSSLPFLAGIFLRKLPVWKTLLAAAIIAVLFWANHLGLPITATFVGGFVAVYWRMDAQRIELAKSKTAAVLALISLISVVVFLYDPFNILGILLLTVFFVVIASGNTLFGLLKMRSALWLGEISYSIYLCHGLILWVVMQNVLPRFSGYRPTVTFFVLSAIGITPVVILFSSVSFLFLERPFIALGHRISKRSPVDAPVTKPEVTVVPQLG